MKPLNKKFACFGNANVTNDEELLALARDAGCTAWGIGFETISQQTIDALHKKPNQPQKYKHVVKKLHEYDMAVIGSFVFGFETDTPDVFDATLQAMYDYEIDSIAVSILTPLPGTPLYERLKKQGRLLTTDWSKYDMYHVVFQPQNMTTEELYEGTRRVCREYYSFSNILKRVLKSRHLGIFAMSNVLTHLISTRVVYRSVFNMRYLHDKKPIASPLGTPFSRRNLRRNSASK